MLPEDVLRHYQYTQRPKGDLGENILYSDRENVSVYDTMGETDRLIKENEKFKADVERLKERLKIERQVTHGNYFNENQLNAVAGHLRKISNSNYSKPELVKQLNVAFLILTKLLLTLLRRRKLEKQPPALTDRLNFGMQCLNLLLKLIRHCRMKASPVRNLLSQPIKM